MEKEGFSQGKEGNKDCCSTTSSRGKAWKRESKAIKGP